MGLPVSLVCEPAQPNEQCPRPAGPNPTWHCYLDGSPIGEPIRQLPGQSPQKLSALEETAVLGANQHERAEKTSAIAKAPVTTL